MRVQNTTFLVWHESLLYSYCFILKIVVLKTCNFPLLFSYLGIQKWSPSRANISSLESLRNCLLNDICNSLMYCKRISIRSTINILSFYSFDGMVGYFCYYCIMIHIEVLCSHSVCVSYPLSELS